MRSLLARYRRIDKQHVDTALAVVLAVIAVIAIRASAAEAETRPNVLAYVLALIGTVSLAWRRRYPATVMVVATASAAAISSIGFPDGVTPLAALISFYSAAAYGRRQRVGLAAVVLALTLLALWITRDVSHTTGEDLLSNIFVFGAAWAVGEIIRTRRERIATLEERAAVLERERLDEAQRAVAEERLRIAQELHDVVAHAMSVITVQAGVGAHVIDSQPAEAKRALEAIETTGRQALQELRRMLGVLRSEEDPRGLRAPAPAIDDVEALVQSVRDAGVPVELRWEGDRDTPVPESVRLTGFRILQEALTNVMKHAGRAKVTVTIRLQPGRAAVEVVDDGRGLSGNPSGTGGGHGLIGMRERVAVFSGTLVAGPVTGGGFRVEASLPFEPPGPVARAMTLRVVVADDQALVRAGFVVLLGSADDIEVVGEASNGAEAVALATSETPDVVLMDVRMPVMDGIEATRMITRGAVATRVLILTTFDLDEYVYDGLRAGASGFLLKDTPPAELLRAVRVVAGGEALLAPNVTRRLIEEFVRRPEPNHASQAPIEGLTDREREVLSHVARGLSNAELAELLHMSHATAKTHVSRLLTKLHARDRAQLVMIAYETGTVMPGAE